MINSDLAKIVNYLGCQYAWNPATTDYVLKDIFRQYSSLIDQQYVRTYHNLQHIYVGLNLIDEYYDQNEGDITTMLAAWLFHDYYYSIKNKYTNESDSAQKGKDTCGHVVQVWQLIMATKHDQVMTDYPAQFIQDIDLATFACEDHQYWSDLVRMEYAGYSDADFYKGRIDFLNKLMKLKNNKLFSTSHFSRFNDIARKNIDQQLDHADLQIKRSKTGVYSPYLVLL